ncbi:hypothetical protein C4K13_1043 [Pseudomonas chlororaphis subsp. aureofaciens]|nr:hypothetical protein C4K13_1043 [Pseudomonas chlororaphis subsp. aureofaciens]
MAASMEEGEFQRCASDPCDLIEALEASSARILLGLGMGTT